MLPTKIIILLFSFIFIGLCYPLYLCIQKILDKGCRLFNKDKSLINVFLNLYIENEIINDLFNIQIGEKITLQNLFENLFSEVQTAMENDFIFKGIIKKKLIDIGNLDLLTHTYYKYCIAFSQNQELFEGASTLSLEKSELFIKKFEEFNKFKEHCKDIQQISIYAILALSGMIACLFIIIFSTFRLAFCGPDSCFNICCNNQEKQALQNK